MHRIQGLGLQVENLGFGEPNTSKDEPDLLKISVLRKSYSIVDYQIYWWNECIDD